MATTRDQAYQQYQGIYNEFGRGDLLDAETDRQFEDYWKNASADSGMLQGDQYRNQTWDSLMPSIRDSIYNRVNDGPDSQGSEPILQAPTQGAQQPTASPAVPSSPRDTALQQVSQTYSSSTPFLGGMRDALMSQLGVNSQPVSAQDSQLSPIISAMRLENQRAAERQRSAMAASMNHPDMNLGDSGAFDAGLQGILQAQGEANARGIGGILSGELARRGNALQSLLGMGLQSGASEAGLNLQGYLGNQADARYYAGLGQDQSQFEDRTAYDYNALQQQGNLQALLALLNAGF